MWEQGRIYELLERVEGRCAAALEHLPRSGRGEELVVYAEKHHKAATCTIKRRYRKAMKSFYDKCWHDASMEHRTQWAADLIIQSERPESSEAEITAEAAWAAASVERARSDEPHEACAHLPRPQPARAHWRVARAPAAGAGGEAPGGAKALVSYP